MRSILLDLNKTSVDIEASAIVSTDGLIIESVLPQKYDEDYLGATAGLLLLGVETVRFSASGALEQILIHCTKNTVVVVRIGEEILLTVVLTATANIDALAFTIQQAREKIIAHTALF